MTSIVPVSMFSKSLSTVAGLGRAFYEELERCQGSRGIETLKKWKNTTTTTTTTTVTVTVTTKREIRTTSHCNLEYKVFFSFKLGERGATARYY